MSDEEAAVAMSPQEQRDRVLAYLEWARLARAATSDGGTYDVPCPLSKEELEEAGLTFAAQSQQVSATGEGADGAAAASSKS